MYSQHIKSVLQVAAAVVVVVVVVVERLTDAVLLDVEESLDN